MTTLKTTCERALHDRYPAGDRPWAALRLEQELRVIRDRDQAPLFAEALDNARRIRDRGDSCRLIGSACASLVAYLTGLSDVDPIEHELPYERFLETSKQLNIEFLLVATQTHADPAAPDSSAAAASDGAIMIHAAQDFDHVAFLAARRVGRVAVGTGCAAGRRDDPATFALLGTGDVKGIAQLDDTDLSHLLRARRPRSLIDIAAIKAVEMESITRPGLIERFARENDEQHGHSSHPLVAETLRETHGFILFEEQIMLLLHRLADIPLADGYVFIKAVKWGKNDEEKAVIELNFLDGAVKHGLTEADAEALFDRIEDAAKVVLCKSHHMAQAVLTYEAAYLKAHHPHEFHEALQQVSQGATADH